MIPALAHRPTHALLAAPGLLDERSAARKHRSHRAPQTLAQIDPHAVEGRRESPGLHPALDHRIQQTRTVHVHAQSVLCREFGKVIDRLDRPDRTAPEIGALLHRNQGSARHVAIPGTNRGACLRRRVDAGNAVHRIHRHAAQRGGGAGFHDHEVRRALGDHLVARTAEDMNGDLVAHGARRQKDRGFLAEQRRHSFAERVDGGVIVTLLVAHRRFGDGTAHPGSGPGLGIAVEIDHDIVSVLLRRTAGKGRHRAAAAEYCALSSAQRALESRNPQPFPAGAGSVFRA